MNGWIWSVLDLEFLNCVLDHLIITLERSRPFYKHTFLTIAQYNLLVYEIVPWKSWSLSVRNLANLRSSDVRGNVTIVRNRQKNEFGHLRIVSWQKSIRVTRAQIANERNNSTSVNRQSLAIQRSRRISVFSYSSLKPSFETSIQYFDNRKWNTRVIISLRPQW